MSCSVDNKGLQIEIYESSKRKGQYCNIMFVFPLNLNAFVMLWIITLQVNLSFQPFYVLWAPPLPPYRPLMVGLCYSTSFTQLLHTLVHCRVHYSSSYDSERHILVHLIPVPVVWSCLWLLYHTSAPYIRPALNASLSLRFNWTR